MPLPNSYWPSSFFAEKWNSDEEIDHLREHREGFLEKIEQIKAQQAK